MGKVWQVFKRIKSVLCNTDSMKQTADLIIFTKTPKEKKNRCKILIEVSDSKKAINSKLEKE